MKHERIIRVFLILIIAFLTYQFGIYPTLSGESYEKARHRQKLERWSKGEQDGYSVIVVGSTPEGVAAALASARSGIRTLLITENMNLGSYITSSLIARCNPEIGILDDQKKQLNTGIFGEIFNLISYNFVPEEYALTVKKLTRRERNLDVIYSAGILSANREAETVNSIRIYSNGKKYNIEASVFVDATEDGKLLELLGVPYFLGSEDINVKKCYMPVKFNFKLGNVNWKDIERVRKTSEFKIFKKVLDNYELQLKNTRLVDLAFIGQPDDKIIVSGLEITNVDVTNPDALKQAYKDGMREAKMFTAYLKTAFTIFEDCVFETGPEKLFIPEKRHFKGRYTLKVSDILENRNFESKVVLASSPVDAGKFVANGYEYILGNPKVYSIPLECLIPVGLDNVFMLGNKVSYSSLAATSSGKIATNISLGEAVGDTIFYCFINDKKPSELLEMNTDEKKRYIAFLNRAGLYLPEFSEENPNIKHWAYPYVKVLIDYGLVAGGMNNDYRFEAEANQDNLALLIINMVYKALPYQYTLEFDKRVRPYVLTKKLTGEKAAEILLAAHNIPFKKGNALLTANRKGVIPSKLKNVLGKDKPVTMAQVYYLTVYNIKTKNAY